MIKLSIRSAIYFFSAVLSGILLFASFPPLEITFLAWIALIPLICVLSYSGYLSSFLLSTLTGTIYSMLHVKWLLEVPGFSLLALSLIGVYTGLFFGLFGLLYVFITRRTGWPAVLVAPVLWVTMEYMRANFFFLAIPVGLLGHSQYNNIPIIQTASFASMYGISFLVMLSNAAASRIAIQVAQFRCAPASPVTMKGAIFSATTALVIITGLYLWGWHQVKSYRDSAETLKVSVVQGNIPQGEKWDARFKQKIMDKYRVLTLRAAAGSPDLIVWPETATPGYIRQDILIFKNMRELMQEIQIPLLFGSASHAKIKREGKKIDKLVNTAILMNSSGKMVSSYNKLRLLPFGEYLPLEGRFPWPEWLVPKNGYFIPGKIATVFEMPQTKFGVVICWENLFPELFRRFVVNGSQFMINLTNEAWFGKSSASRQFLSMSVFRAVENRVALIRCANSGISCLIDPLGRIVAKVEDKKGNDIMIDGVLTTSVPKSGTTTFYTKYGDVFVFSCIVLGVLFVISALFPERVRRFGASDSAQDQP